MPVETVLRSFEVFCWLMAPLMAIEYLRLRLLMDRVKAEMAKYEAATVSMILRGDFGSAKTLHREWKSRIKYWGAEESPIGNRVLWPWSAQ